MTPKRKVESLADHLRARVESLPPHAPLPTERDLMKRHGVSRETVRRALDRLAMDHLIYRRAPRGTFVAPAPRGRTVLLVTHDMVQKSGVSTLLPRFVLSFLRGLHDSDRTLLPALVSDRRFLRELPNLKETYPDIAAVVFYNMNPVVVRAAPHLRALDIPAVAWGTDEGPWPASVSGILFCEGDLVAKALDGMGLPSGSDVMWWGPDHYGFVKHRRSVFEAEARRRALHLVTCPGFPAGPEGNTLAPLPNGPAIRRWLRSRKKILGVLSGTDTHGIQFVNLAASAGVAIPKQVRVVAVGSSPVGELSPIPLAIMDLPLEQAGHACVTDVLDRLGGGAPRVEWLPCNLVARGSIPRVWPGKT